MYWLPKTYKTPIAARFVVASYYCSTNLFSATISKNFKIIFNTVKSFHKKGFFYLGCNKFWVMQNSFSIATMLNKINFKKKSISTFQCSTFYTTTRDKLLMKVLSEVISFDFKSKIRQHIGFSKTVSFGLLRVLEEYTLLSTLFSMLSFLINKYFVTLLAAWFLNKIFAYRLILTQHHFGPTFFFTFLNLSK